MNCKWLSCKQTWMLLIYSSWPSSWINIPVLECGIDALSFLDFFSFFAPSAFIFLNTRHSHPLPPWALHKHHNRDCASFICWQPITVRGSFSFISLSQAPTLASASISRMTVNTVWLCCEPGMREDRQTMFSSASYILIIDVSPILRGDPYYPLVEKFIQRRLFFHGFVIQVSQVST